MKRLPYYKMYPQDFDCDEKVRLLNMKEAGLFLFALNHAWVNDGLPSEPEEIARVLRVPMRDFLNSWPRVSAMFAADCCGRLRNKRQEAERIEAEHKSIKATESIKARWKTDTNVSKTNGIRIENELPRARVSDSDSDSDTETTKTICEPDGSRAFVLAPPENGNGHAKPLKEQKHPQFAAFWDLRWRTDDRKAAEKSFRKALDIVSVETIMAAVAREKPRQLEKEPQYRPMMSTWLNKRRFLDEAEPEQLAIPPKRSNGGGVNIEEVRESLRRQGKI